MWVIAITKHPLAIGVLGTIVGLPMVLYCRRLGVELARRVSGGGSAVVVVLAAGLFFLAIGLAGLVAAA